MRRSTIRLSFSETDSGRKSSTLSRPIVMCRRPGTGPRLHRLRDLFDRHALDDVAHQDVVEAIEADAALHAGPHLADIVLEPSQRGDPALPDLVAVAQHARLNVGAARDAALGHHAAGARAGPPRPEDLPDLGRADPRLAKRPIETALHRIPDHGGDVLEDSAVPG